MKKRAPKPPFQRNPVRRLKGGETEIGPPFHFGALPGNKRAPVLCAPFFRTFRKRAEVVGDAIRALQRKIRCFSKSAARFIKPAAAKSFETIRKQVVPRNLFALRVLIGAQGVFLSFPAPLSGGGRIARLSRFKSLNTAL